MRGLIHYSISHYCVEVSNHDFFIFFILLNSFHHIASSAHLRQHSSIHIYPAPPRRPPSMTSFLLLPTSSGLPDAKYLWAFPSSWFLLGPSPGWHRGGLSCALRDPDIAISFAPPSWPHHLAALVWEPPGWWSWLQLKRSDFPSNPNSNHSAEQLLDIPNMVLQNHSTIFQYPNHINTIFQTCNA